MSAAALAPRSSRTCASCRMSKVRCVGGYPCERCISRKTPCVPSTKKSGKQTNKRRRVAVPEGASASSSLTAAAGKNKKRSKITAGKRRALGDAFGVGTGRIEDAMARSVANSDACIGVRFLVRHWYGLATARRSVYLLSKAFGLADRLGMTLDEMVGRSAGLKCCNRASVAAESAATMRVFTNRLLSPLPPAEGVLPRVASCDLPVVLSDRFAATGGDVENRWILVRNDVGGQIRFYITAAFERDICTYANVKQAFLENEIPFMSLWDPEDPNPGEIHDIHRGHGRNIASVISQYTSMAEYRCAYGRRRLKMKTSAGESSSIVVNTEMGIYIQGPHESWCVSEFRLAPFVLPHTAAPSSADVSSCGDCSRMSNNSSITSSSIDVAASTSTSTTSVPILNAAANAAASPISRLNSWSAAYDQEDIAAVVGIDADDSSGDDDTELMNMILGFLE